MSADHLGKRARLAKRIERLSAEFRENARGHDAIRLARAALAQDEHKLLRKSERLMREVAAFENDAAR